MVSIIFAGLLTTIQTDGQARIVYDRVLAQDLFQAGHAYQCHGTAQLIRVCTVPDLDIVAGDLSRVEEVSRKAASLPSIQDTCACEDVE